MASLIASPGSHRIFTKPCWWARSAVIVSPVNAISIAIFCGTRFGNRVVPPAMATRDRLTSGRPKAALGDATTRSHARTNSQPPATAGPSTAAITGFVLSNVTNPPNPPRLVPRFAFPDATALRSAPAQKTGPLPARIPTHTSSSASSLSMASSRACANSPETALRASGLFNVMTAVRPLFSYSTIMS